MIIDNGFHISAREITRVKVWTFLWHRMQLYIQNMISHLKYRVLLVTILHHHLVSVEVDSVHLCDARLQSSRSYCWGKSRYRWYACSSTCCGNANLHLSTSDLRVFTIRVPQRHHWQPESMHLRRASSNWTETGMKSFWRLPISGGTLFSVDI